MCISQDVRGNIKLSLKATLPRPEGMKTGDVVEGSVPHKVETPTIFVPVGKKTTHKKQDSASELGDSKSPTSKIPSILIRSAAECDQEEKSTTLNESSKRNPKSVNDSKSKSRQSQDTIPSPPKSKSHQSEDVIDSKPNTKSRKSRDVVGSAPSNSVPLCNEKSKKSKTSVQKEKPNSVLQRPEGDAKEAGDKAVTAKSMKLGVKVTAKVDQLRAHGLVLDLGGGLRGMYKFEV